MLNIRLALLSILISFSIFSQTSCSDPQSVNYSPPDNDINSGCFYSPSIYQMPVKYLLDAKLDETSGLIYFRGDIWTINDGGNTSVLYHLDLESGKILQEITISNRKNNDWESLTQDDEFIYIGAFGNNHGVRSIVYVYKVRKSDVPKTGNAEVLAERIRFAYENYVLPEDEKNHNFDCEAFISVGDSLYFFTKNREDQKTNLYRISKEPGRRTAEMINTFDVDGLVTGANYDEANNQLILVGYTNNKWMPFMWVFTNFKGVKFFSGNQRRIDMPQLPAPQIESVCFTSEGEGVIISEARISFHHTAYSFTTDQWLKAVDWKPLMTQADEFDFDIVDSKGKSIELKFTSIPEADYLIEIYDSNGKFVPVFKHSFEKSFGKVYLKINTSHFKKGNYKISICSGNKVQTENYIKK